MGVTWIKNYSLDGERALPQGARTRARKHLRTTYTCTPLQKLYIQCSITRCNFFYYMHQPLP